MHHPFHPIWIACASLLALGALLGGCDSGAAPTSAPATNVPPAQNTSAPPGATTAPPAQVTTVPLAQGTTVPVATVLPQIAIPRNPTHSSPIAVTSDDATLLVVNPLNNSVTIVNVKGDANQKLASVTVGVEPQAVAITSDDKFAYVTNQGSQSVSLIDRQFSGNRSGLG